MNALAERVLIVGQGLAGTALGLELEAAGVDFVVASEGHAHAASRVAAGLINPITGQRWAKSAQIDALLPRAEKAYRRWEEQLGHALWHPVTLRRLFRDDEERTRIVEKISRGEMAPFVGEVDATGMTVCGAAWVDLPALLAAAEERWRGAGKLRPTTVVRAEFQAAADGVSWAGEKFAAAVLCTGHGALAREFFPDMPWVAAKGEILHVEGAGIVAGEVVNRGVWLLGEGAGRGRLGATYERGQEDNEITANARDVLLAQGCELGRGELRVVDQVAGVRMTLPDRLPVAGWRSDDIRLGLCGGLGSKGALWAPMLAQCWRAVLTDPAEDFPKESAAARFAGKTAG